MKTRKFIEALRNSADKELVFANADGRNIHAGYHLTEIKAASFETVDCGGKTNRWNETILQLWVPEDAEDSYMKSEVSARYDKVRRMVSVDEDAEIGSVWGENFFAAAYHIGDWRVDDGRSISAGPPAATCKRAIR